MPAVWALLRRGRPAVGCRLPPPPAMDALCHSPCVAAYLPLWPCLPPAARSAPLGVGSVGRALADPPFALGTAPGLLA
eukprot:3846209-Alexandrium_andersonii.AAC.1